MDGDCQNERLRPVGRDGGPSSEHYLEQALTRIHKNILSARGKLDPVSGYCNDAKREDKPQPNPGRAGKYFLMLENIEEDLQELHQSLNELGSFL